MRISDWSSDVCSSDLFRREEIPGGLLPFFERRLCVGGESQTVLLHLLSNFGKFSRLEEGAQRMRPDRGLPRPGRAGDVKEPQRELTVGAGDGHDLIEWECHCWILFIMIYARRACHRAATIGWEHMTAPSHGDPDCLP